MIADGASAVELATAQDVDRGEQLSAAGSGIGDGHFEAVEAIVDVEVFGLELDGEDALRLRRHEIGVGVAGRLRVRSEDADASLSTDLGVDAGEVQRLDAGTGHVLRLRHGDDRIVTGNASRLDLRAPCSARSS
jgi:hypothetical protein